MFLFVTQSQPHEIDLIHKSEPNLKQLNNDIIIVLGVPLVAQIFEDVVFLILLRH